jgi:hypothetical protein
MIAAVLALVGAILNFATRKPLMRLVAVALALLTVSACEFQKDRTTPSWQT